MADSIIKRDGKLIFTTTSKDFKTNIILPDGSDFTTQLEDGSEVPTRQKGLHVLGVADRGGATFSVTLTGGKPPAATKRKKQMVLISYEVKL